MTKYAGQRGLDVGQVWIEEAKQTLEMPAGSINDLAVQVGYLDPAAFRRTFRKLAGTTPAEYRWRFANLVPSGKRMVPSQDDG